MCCEFILKYFREDYDDIDDCYEEENSFDKALDILDKYEPGLVLHYSHNGKVTFSGNRLLFQGKRSFSGKK